MTPHDMSRTGRVTPVWLDLRGPADAAARDGSTVSLAERLDDFLHLRIGGDLSDHARPGGGGRPATLVDVGAGMGAGAQWLRPKLSVRQRWVLVDPDESLLAEAPPCRDGWAVAVAGDTGSLTRVAAEHRVDAVTCQALLDMLTRAQADDVIDAATGRDAAVLASLTVTGRVTMDPAEDDDAWVGEAFNAHQRRQGRLGPDAAGHVAGRLRRGGYDVTTARSPWHLNAASGALLQQWLLGYAAAAREQSPESAAHTDAWLRRRFEQARQGRLAAVVEHLDVLATPNR